MFQQGSNALPHFSEFLRQHQDRAFDRYQEMKLQARDGSLKKYKPPVAIPKTKAKATTKTAMKRPASAAFGGIGPGSAKCAGSAMRAEDKGPAGVAIPKTKAKAKAG